MIYPLQFQLAEAFIECFRKYKFLVCGHFSHRKVYIQEIDMPQQLCNLITFAGSEQQVVGSYGAIR